MNPAQKRLEAYYRDENVIPLGMQAETYMAVTERLMPDEIVKQGYTRNILLCGMHPNTSTIHDFTNYIEFLEQTYNAPFNGIITDINPQPFDSAQQKGVNLDIQNGHRTQGGSLIRGIQCDLTTSPFKSGVFSIVIADYTLGCVQKDKTQLFANEIQRLLTPNGLAFIAFREKIFPSFRREYVRPLPSRFVYETFQKCEMKLILNCESNSLHDDLMVFGHNKSNYAPYRPPIYEKSILNKANF